MGSRDIRDLADRLAKNGESILASMYRNAARRLEREEEYERNRPIIDAMNRRYGNE